MNNPSTRETLHGTTILAYGSEPLPASGQKAARSSAETDPDYWEGLINEGDAARFLGFSVRALQGWRYRGGGPSYIRVSGRGVRYRRRDLKEWAESLLRSSTSDPCQETGEAA